MGYGKFLKTKPLKSLLSSKVVSIVSRLDLTVILLFNEKFREIGIKKGKDIKAVKNIYLQLFQMLRDSSKESILAFEPS